MPFDRESFDAIVARIAGDHEVYPDLDPQAAGTELRAGIVMLAAQVHKLQGGRDEIVRSHFPDVCDGADLASPGLLHTGPQHYALKATATISLPTTSGSRITLYEGTLIEQMVTGLRYRIVTDATERNAAIQTRIEAEEPGAKYDLTPGDNVQLVDPVDGVSPGIVATASDGSDDETLEAYRTRVVRGIRYRNQGGTLHDYERWVRESAPSRWSRVWAQKPLVGQSASLVYAVNDSLDLDHSGTDIAESAANYTSATDYCNDPSRITLIASVTVLAPTLVPIDPNIITTPATGAIHDQVSASIAEMLRDEATISGTIPNHLLRLAIQRAPGLESFTLNSPTGAISVSAGELSVLGTATWV